jgi:serine/threonine protein kinase
VEPGDVVGDRFAIERIAGAGGMGTVYRARDLSTGSPVALKVLRRGVGDHVEEQVLRFEREAALLATLEHPSIVRFVASGATPEGQCWLVMQWLEGEDLAQRLARGVLSIPDALDFGRRVAEALQVAHARGIIHRDLKPGNVFLLGGDLRRPLVLDFGIARALDRGGTITEAGAALGTPGYMAPEQAKAATGLDTRVDVYSLGCLLFRCLAGQPPFTGDPLGILLRVVLDPPPLLGTFRPGVPQALEALVQRMLARSPDARPADGGAVAAELSALMGEGNSVPPSRSAREASQVPHTLSRTPNVGSSRPPASSPSPAHVPVTPALSAAGPPVRPRRWVVPVVGAVAAVALGGIAAVALLDVSPAGGHLRTSGTTSGAATAEGSCPGTRCAPFAPADPANIDALDLVAQATALAQSIDRTATLTQIFLKPHGDVQVAIGRPGMPVEAMVSFATKGGRGVTVWPAPDRLVAMDGTALHPVPMPTACPPRAALLASGMPVRSIVTMTWGNDGIGLPTWIFFGPSVVVVEGRTCRKR